MDTFLKVFFGVYIIIMVAVIIGIYSYNKKHKGEFVPSILPDYERPEPGMKPFPPAPLPPNTPVEQKFDFRTDLTKRPWYAGFQGW